MAHLEFGAAFSRVFDLYGRYAAKLLTYSATFYLAVTVAWLGIVGALGTSDARFGLAALVGILITVVASMILTGMYVVGLHDANRTGEFPSFGAVWPRVSPRIAALVGTSLLAAVGILLGMLLLIIPGLVLMTWWAVIAPVVMLEQRSGSGALSRSRDLVRGNGWTVFGLLVVVNVIVGIASSIIGAIVGGLLGGSDELLGKAGSQFVSGTLTAPIVALLAIVMYEALSGTGETPGGPGRDTTGATGMPPQHPGAPLPPAPGTPAPPAQQPPTTQPPVQQPPTTDDGRSGPFV